MKGSGKPDDRKGHVRFDVAGAGNGFTVRLVRHRQTKETEQIGFTYGTPRQSSTLPFEWLCVFHMAGFFVQINSEYDKLLHLSRPAAAHRNGATHKNRDCAV